MLKKTIWLVFLLCIAHYSLTAQSFVGKATVDTNNLLIGDQLHYIIITKSSAGTKILFPAIKDSIGKIEFLQTYKTDTLAQNGYISLRKSYLITSFDEGTHFIPGLPIYAINGKNGKIDTFYTNTVSVRFIPVKVDTTKPFKDIKPIMNEPIDFWEYLPYIVIVIIFVVLVFAGIRLWKKYKRKDTPGLNYDPSIPPHIIAKEALQQLENEKLWQKGQIKLYHSRLSDILRTYIERQYGFPAMEMTTSEIVGELKERNINAELTADLKKVLDLADLVKFAKYHPLPDENATSMALTYKFVDATTPVSDISSNKEGTDDVQ
jgi:hypothetical protein